MSYGSRNYNEKVFEVRTSFLQKKKLDLNFSTLYQHRFNTSITTFDAYKLFGEIQ